MTPPSAAHAHARHRPGVRRGAAPRAPRRVSGPAGDRFRPRAVAGGAVAVPRPAAGALGLPRTLARRVAALADSRLLDRLLTGRVWIGIVAFALIGIVFMQVSLLKLNAGIGRAVEQAQNLERVNADLRSQVSELGSSDRIQQVAERLGLELPPAGSTTFLGRDGRRVGGDGVTQLAIGTQTGPAAAGVGAGATAAGPGAATASSATAATATAQQQPTPAATATTSQAATPTASATSQPSAGASPAARPAGSAGTTAGTSTQPTTAPATAAGGATTPAG